MTNNLDKDQALGVWAQLSYALNQHNARGRASASGKARRMVAELYGDAHDPTRTLDSYYDELDKLVGMGSFPTDWYESP
jgi:hypothetical protein